MWVSGHFLCFTESPSSFIMCLSLLKNKFQQVASVKLWEKLRCLTLEISQGVNPPPPTLNTAMKKTAVFHYTEWKNRAGGQWEESWGNTLTGLELVEYHNTIYTSLTSSLSLAVNIYIHIWINLQLCVDMINAWPLNSVWTLYFLTIVEFFVSLCVFIWADLPIGLRGLIRSLLCCRVRCSL